MVYWCSEAFKKGNRSIRIWSHFPNHPYILQIECRIGIHKIKMLYRGDTIQWAETSWRETFAQHITSALTRGLKKWLCVIVDFFPAEMQAISSFYSVSQLSQNPTLVGDTNKIQMQYSDEVCVWDARSSLWTLEKQTPSRSLCVIDNLYAHKGAEQMENNTAPM